MSSVLVLPLDQTPFEYYPILKIPNLSNRVFGVSHRKTKEGVVFETREELCLSPVRDN